MKNIIGEYMRNIGFYLLMVFVVPLHAQWVQTSLDTTTVTAFASNGANIFVGNGQGVFLSTNNGANWTAVNSGLTNTNVRSLIVFSNGTGGTNIFAGTDGWYGRWNNGSGIFHSTNNGLNWISDTCWGIINALSVIGTNLFAGGNSGGDYSTCLFTHSTNSGSSWIDIKISIKSNFGLNIHAINAFAANDSNLIVGTNCGVCLFKQNGTDWSQVNSGLITFSIQTLVASGSNIFAGTTKTPWSDSSGVFRSTNNGESWFIASTGLPRNSEIYSLVNSGKNLFAGTRGAIYLSTDNGENWSGVNLAELPPDFYAKTLSVSGMNLFAGIAPYGVWRRPLSEMIPTSAEESMSQLPESYSLQQNFPNPFNPSTTIRYSLPSSVNVKLAVYDLLGREIALLVNEEQSAGWKEVHWDASNFASGMYLVRMQAGSFNETKKIMLME